MQAVRQSAAGGPDGMAAALADELGLSETEVQEALESFRPQGGPGGGAPPDGAAPPSGTAPDGSDGTTPPSDAAPSTTDAGAVPS